VDYSTTTPGRVAKTAASAVQAGALPRRRTTAARACHRPVRRSLPVAAPAEISYATQFSPASLVVSYVSRDANRLYSRDMEGTSG
jgi:hypothetical protein